MRRGTTPVLRFVTPYDWTGYKLELTLEENDVELVFGADRITLVDNTDVLITLTQEETLQFSKSCQAQIRGKNGSTVVATDIAKIKVLPILREEVI